MHPKSKNTNKDCKRQSKRIPLATIVPSYTEDIHLTAYQSAEIKAGPKTMDLRKPASGNPYKKTVSRKSNSKSVKQHPSYQPPKLKSLMKQFKELKLLHENERSKSKSPAFCKSRSNEKHLPKKLSFKTFTNSRRSEPNLTVKLEKTLKKLDETNFFREEDSLIPLSSSSGDVSHRRREVLFTEHDEIVDMGEVREFCSTATISFKKTEGLAFKTYDLFKETMAALKIQRAWRKYQTKRIIGQYAFLYQQDHSHHYLHRHDGPLSPEMEDRSGEQMQVPQSEVVLMSEDCYDSSVEGDKPVRRVSNLQSESSVGEEEDMVTRMKMQELQKWNQIIKIISGSRNQDPKSLEMLLSQLARQSEMNKMELEQKVKSATKNNPPIERERSRQSPDGAKNEQQEKGNGSKRVQHQRDQSSSSQGMEEYDSKKYIEYLDGDIFVEEEQDHKHRPTFINKHQQQCLLQTLAKQQQNKGKDHHPQIGNYSLNKSESLTALLQGPEEEYRPSSREGLRRSTSEKTLKKILSQLEDEKHSDEEINLELLTKEFLEGTDPLSDNFDMVYSEEKLRSKLAELNKFKNQHEQGEDQEEKRIHSPQDISVQKTQSRRELEEEKRPQNRPAAGCEIRIEQNESPVKIDEDGIGSSSSDLVSEEDEKSETVAAILMNNLVVEVLKEIASRDKLSAAFKSYSLSLKPKVRKAEGKKKKGFPTTKAEIQHFIEGLLAYLAREEPDVYSNLEVPTGPSALEMLRYMHQNGEDSWDQGSSSEEDSNVMVIPNRVFDAFWGIKQRSIVIEVPEGYEQSGSMVFKHQFQLLKSFNKIFYRSLFDTFNQCLDLERNYGQYGRPFPWKKTPVFDHHKSKCQLAKSVEKAKSRMLELSTTYCGLIVEKEELVSISEEYIQQVHQDRLSRMLAGDLLEAEERWVFYDDEETEILVEVSNAIYTELLIELIETLYGLA